MYIYIHIYTRIYIYVYIYTYVHIHMYIYTCTYIYNIYTYVIAVYIRTLQTYIQENTFASRSVARATLRPPPPIHFSCSVALFLVSLPRIRANKREQ